MDGVPGVFRYPAIGAAISLAVSATGRDGEALWSGMMSLPVGGSRITRVRSQRSAS